MDKYKIEKYEIIVENYSEEEQNPYYDEGKTWDGGGYHQPYIKAVGTINGKQFEIIHDDTSCGGFGTRYTTTIMIDNKIVYFEDYNNIDSIINIIEEEEAFKEINECLLKFFVIK